MTNPKTPEPGAARSESKPAAASASASPPSPGPPHTGQNAALEQLVALTRSIGELVKQNAASSGQVSAATTTSAAEAAQQARVVFAYDFLGVVLGRRAPSVFQLTRVNVTRATGAMLTFTDQDLNGATAAKVRSADNHVQLLTGLTPNTPVSIGQKAPPPNQAIDDGVPIDSIVTFTSLGGTPVAIGPCLQPVAGGVIQ